MCMWILILRYTFIYIYIWVLYMSQFETYHVCMRIHFCIDIFIPCGYFVDSNLCCTYIYIYLHIYIFAYSYFCIFIYIYICAVGIWEGYFFTEGLCSWAMEHIRTYEQHSACMSNRKVMNMWVRARICGIQNMCRGYCAIRRMTTSPSYKSTYACVHAYACLQHAFFAYVRVCHEHFACPRGVNAYETDLVCFCACVPVCFCVQQHSGKFWNTSKNDRVCCMRACGRVFVCSAYTKELKVCQMILCACVRACVCVYMCLCLCLCLYGRWLGV